MNENHAPVPTREKLRVAFITTQFSPLLAGYSDVALPKAMAALGADVHVISANLNPYYYHPEYKKTYERFLGPAITSCGVEQAFGFVLHRLPHKAFRGHIFIPGLYLALKDIQPHVVHTWSAVYLTSLQAAAAKVRLGFKLFTAQHTTASVFPLANKVNPGVIELLRNFITNYMPGRVISWMSERCYPATPDCLDIAVRFYGAEPRKCSLRSLGVDTDSFAPASSPQDLALRQQMRLAYGFADSDIVSIYTGRLVEDKNPLCLAKAIDALSAAGKPFKALFVGNGPQRADIQACRGCCVEDFVEHKRLPAFYRCADVGVWPTQESTSMLDAAACGLPIIVSDRLVARERIQGNGMTYLQNDVADLQTALYRLSSSELRSKLGSTGVSRMRECFSWEVVARTTLADFRKSLGHRVAITRPMPMGAP